MSFYRENPCKKLKKEVEVLLKRPDRMGGAKGVIIAREEMAAFRINNAFDNLYKQTRKQYREQLKEAKIGRAKFRKKSNMTLKELVDLGLSMMTQDEKQKIYDTQEERLQRIAESGVPAYLLMEEEQITAKIEKDCETFGKMMSMTPDEFLAENPKFFEKVTKKERKKRAPSKRNLFIGKMIREKKAKDLKEASDIWKIMSPAEREAFQL